MSELKVDKVSPRTGNYVSLNTVSMKNIIINGDMSIAQRGTSATGLGNGDAGYHTIDRMRFNEAGAPTFEFTMSQDTDVPTGQGFATSLKMDCTTAQGSLASGDALLLQQLIEGQMLQYLKKGTANAESLTLSFWVKSNKTGTYIANLYDGDNTRQISKSYTIDASNTWEKKTITFAGDTTGAFDNNNSVSLYLQLYLGAGSAFSSGTLATSWESANNANTAVGQVNLADNTANNFWITGIQLEAGTTASDFEFLPYDVNKNRCLRYFAKLGADAQGSSNYQAYGSGSNNTNTSQNISLTFPQTMRSSPSISYSGNIGVSAAGSYVNISSIGAIYAGTSSALVQTSSSTVGSQGDGVLLLSNADNTANIQLSAEL